MFQDRAAGGDHKSVIVGARSVGMWEFFRLPEASRSHDGAHGRNTEWPRVIDVGTTGDHARFFPTSEGRFSTEFIPDLSAIMRVRTGVAEAIEQLAKQIPSFLCSIDITEPSQLSCLSVTPPDGLSDPAIHVPSADR